MSAELSAPVDVVMFTIDERIDRRILLEASSLEHAGYSVRVLAPGPRGSASEPAFVERLGEMDKPRRQRGSAYTVQLFRKLRRYLYHFGVRPEQLRAWFWKLHGRPESFFLSIFQSEIERQPARLYIGHDLPMLPVALAAARQHGAKTIFDSHELYPEQDFRTVERQMWERLQSRCIRQADHVVTVNEAIAGELEQRYGIDRPAVVQNCVEWTPRDRLGDGTRLTESLGLDPQTRIVLYQGGLLPHRNLHTLVRAFMEVRRSDCILVFMGDGPALEELTQLAHRLKIQDRVRFHRAVPQDELLIWTHSAHLGVIPYQASCLNSYYCTPNKLFEFLMARVPILASDLPELRRIISLSGAGIVSDLTKPTNVARLIEDILARLDSDPTAYDSALDAAATTYSWEREAEIFCRTVAETLAGSSATTSRQRECSATRPPAL